MGASRLVLRGCCSVALALLVSAAVAAADFEVPALRSAVTDQAGLLSRSSRAKLESALQELRRAGGTELAVLTLPNLAGLTIEQASIRVVDEWKLGTEEADNGVLLLVARDERRIRIEVGQGLEGALTDAYSKRIIDEGITPLFRAGDMTGGITVGVYQIARITNPEINLKPYLEGQLRQRSGRSRRQAPSLLQLLFFLLIGAPIMLARFGLFGGSTFFRGGFGGGGFGGGGFGGGGGGFSGGGASGGW